MKPSALPPIARLYTLHLWPSSRSLEDLTHKFSTRILFLRGFCPSCYFVP